MTTGANDAAVAAGMAAAAGGSLSKTETVRAWSASEFKGVAEKAAKVAGAYKSPGA
jgi:hypothetical protein